MASFMNEFEHLKIQLQAIISATNNFERAKIIGSGGFGLVYKGEVSLSKGQRLVAIKRLDRKFGQGDPEFWKEIMMLSRYPHENLISLLGYCDEAGEKVLVYEHALNGSLDMHLSSTSLTWTQRIKICLDAAKGLRYLHEGTGTHQRVIHRDIKSSNILLDEKWNAKISDMGLSKLGPANQQHTAFVTRIVGTPGYLDPLYLELGILTKESDVYSFGVVLLEVLCGRLCFEKINGNFVTLVRRWKKCYLEKKLPTIIFQYLEQPLDQKSLETFSKIANRCLHEFREERPTMAEVVEELKTALELQEPLDLTGVPNDYKEILKDAVTPICYRSIEGLIKILFDGVFVNKGKTLFSLNDKEEHCELISIKECLILDPQLLCNWKICGDRYSHEYNSRFVTGCYDTRGYSFKTRVKTQFLSPIITYTVNLIFKCPCMFKQKSGKQRYIALTYRLNEGAREIVIVHLEDKSEDEWLMARLYQFTSCLSNVHLEIAFECYENYLLVEGIEFRPMKINVKAEHNDELVLLEQKYQEILKSVEPPLIYTSVQELKLLLSKGVILNRGKTWFYLNDKGQHCEMISIQECIIPDAGKSYDYVSNYNSRFLVGAYHEITCDFKIRVRAQFLTPLITYTMNLVFKFDAEKEQPKQPNIHLKYKLEGETKTSTYFANKREDDWWMVELFQFTSKGTTDDRDIIFEGNDPYIVVEGIEFRPI